MEQVDEVRFEAVLKEVALYRPTSSTTAKLRLTDTDKNIILIVFLAMSISVEFRNTLFVVAHLTKRSNDGLLSCFSDFSPYRTSIRKNFANYGCVHPV